MLVSIFSQHMRLKNQEKNTTKNGMGTIIIDKNR